MNKLHYHFYERDTIVVAKELLGKYIVHRVDNTTLIGKIVEVEAYIGQHDLACHAAKGLTKRTQIMFGQAGHLYVYLIYGMYHCLNIVTEKPGHAAAVLIRAIEPIENISAKTTGPGLLCKAMHIDLALNGESLLNDRIFIIPPPVQSKITIVAKPRIGVAYAKHWAKRLLRFYIKNNAFVSKV